MKFGVVVFPGSNCDIDCYYAVESMGEGVEYIWHHEKDLTGFDCLILPGGFSYGDYLRAGAVARFSPIMEAIKSFTSRGGLVIGICNGFQILLEAGLLPGAMLTNKKLKFICEYVNLRVENNDTFFTSECSEKMILSIPIAHHGGNYFAPKNVLKKLNQNNQVVLRYCDKNGMVSDKTNPNGSLENIAGIINEEGNVFGLMPHPERAIQPILNSSDGRLIFQSIIKNITERVLT